MSKSISANEAQNRLGTWLALVNDTDEEVIIERDGKPRAVLMSISEFEKVEELRKQQRRADGLKRLYAIRDERARPGNITQPAEISPERRAEAFERLEALREEVSARNQDLTEEQIEEIANRFSRDIIDDMVADGTISFERDLRKQG